MAIETIESAEKHGYDRDDAIHAMAHHRWLVEGFDEPRIPGVPAPDLYIGPAPTGELIEVMSYLSPPRDVYIFHIMKLRKKTRDRALDELERRGNQ
ncbi:hypothetical protein [uncultured Corynebacterium sp.]|uniref:hypothetical protein n=1 Tax=uncultured Corynebacterium sp. TaxID=159447 RepID=UPI0015BF1D7D|nr:hypothetical protein [uncultured Corynebacterium sp.]